MISRRKFWSALFGASMIPKSDTDKKKAFIRIKPGGRLENVDITVPAGLDAGVIFEGDMTCTGNLTITTVQPGEFTDRTRVYFPEDEKKKDRR